MKKLAGWIVGLLLSPVLLFLILAALLYVPPIQNWVADRVAAVVSKSTGMEITVGQVNLEWPLDLGIDDFRAIHEGDTLADVSHLTADVELRPLLKSRVVVNELSVRQARLNTNGFISDLRVKGTVGLLWLRSNGIDLSAETAEVNGARLTDADLDIALSDTAATDTTTTTLPWRIKADSLSISRTALVLHLLSDTLNVGLYMGRAVARQADINLATSTYQVGSLDWHNGRLTYDDVSQPAMEGLDYNHIGLSGIRLGIDNISYGSLGTSLYIRQTAMREKSGLQLLQLQGEVRLDSAFNHIELPRLTLRTTDSDLTAEVNTDFNVADSLNPGKMHIRLNAQLGKQDLLRFVGGLPQNFASQYPNHPLSIKGSVNGNLKRMEFTGLDVSLHSAFHVKADGFAANVTDMEQLRCQLALKAETQNLGFVTALAPVNDLRLPPMTLNGQFKADHGRYGAQALLQEGEGTLKASISTTRLTDIVAYTADIEMSRMNLMHFLPGDSLYANTADLTAVAKLRNGRAEATIAGSNALFDGSIGLDALLNSKKMVATVTPRLEKADLYGLRLTDRPLTVGMSGSVSINSDMKLSHELKGLLDNLYIKDAESTYHPEKIGLLVRTSRDTTLARIQSGDFIVKFDGSGSYERLMKQAAVLTDTMMAQFNDKVIDQEAIRRHLPGVKLHVELGRNNPVANLLRSRDIDFKELRADLNTSPTTGVNGNMYLYSLNYDSTRIDTIRLQLVHHEKRLSYQGQIRNNRRNPQFVFNALFDGHFHEHGGLIGLRYFDQQEKLGVRLGATVSMVSDGILIQLMPEHPTIAYKVFNLNSDNFLHIDRQNRVKANIDLVADDLTGMKLYSSEDTGDYLQDLTVSLNRVNLAELTSVAPYLPRMSGILNSDFHIVQDQEEHFSVVSDMAVRALAYEGSPVGNLSTEFVYLQRENNTHAVEARLMLDDEEFGMLQGSMTPANKPDGEGHIDGTFTMTRLPLSLVNGFVPDQLIGLDGYGEGELTIDGPLSQPNINGEVYVDSAYLVSVPYGVRMRFDNDPVRIVGSHLLLENFGLYAYNDEPMDMQGDIDFTDFGNLKMNLRMRARNFQIINAKRTPKSIAYGKAFVNLFSSISGPLSSLAMRGRIDVLGSTDMTYMLLDSPLSTDNRLEELVKFTDFSDSTLTTTVDRPTPTGLDMNLTLSVSQGVHVVCNLNVDETNYVDLMGGGDLRMRYGAEGLSLTGRYTLGSGEMKYSLPVIPLKTFTIQDGSYVEFTGDPMNPRLNITATERTKATVAQEGTQGRSVAFDCGVVITKTLSDMGLQFIIAAPEDNAINSELQAMSTEERGKLAVTMLTTGMYLADGNTGSFSMNSALSSFLQSEINNITGSALKTLDLSVGLDNTADASGQMHTDYSFKFSKRLFNNRLKIQLGGKVSSGAENPGEGQQQSFFDNVTMEYRLDQSATRNVKLFYQQNVYDWLDGYTGLYGGGFVWRRKMDSLSDVLKIFSNDTGRQPVTTRSRTAVRDTLTKDTLRHETHQ